MTKEMRPSHREDILAHALTYYGMKTKKKLGRAIIMHAMFIYDSYTIHTANLILTRWDRAHNTMMIAEETVTTVMPNMESMSFHSMTSIRYNIINVIKDHLLKRRLEYGYLLRRITALISPLMMIPVSAIYNSYTVRAT